jgi:hypothetical protein
MRYTASVFLAVLAGALMSNLPVLGLVDWTLFLHGPDAARSIWPDIFKEALVLSIWTVPGAVNGALGVSVGRGRANRLVFLPACAVPPASLALAQLDSFPARPFDFSLMALTFIPAASIWLAGEVGQMIGSRIRTADDRARIMSMATSEVASALNDSASALWASQSAFNVRVLLFTIAFVAGAGVTSVYFVVGDRPNRQWWHDAKLREAQQITDNERQARQQAEAATDYLRREVTAERKQRERAERRVQELMQALAKKDPIAPKR